MNAQDAMNNNQLTFTENFDPEITDWLFGCDNAISPLLPLELILDGETPNPDGTTPSQKIVVTADARHHGCLRKSYEPLLEVPGEIQAVQTLSIHARPGGSRYFSLNIFDREGGQKHQAVFRWTGDGPVIHELIGLDSEDLVTITEAAHGWTRVAVTYLGTPDDIGNVRNMIIRPSNRPGELTPGLGTYFAQAQLEHGPEMTEYRRVLRLGRFAELLERQEMNG